jgi:hypothetical protein
MATAARYSVAGVDESGKECRIVVDATSEQEALFAAKRQNVFATKVSRISAIESGPQFVATFAPASGDLPTLFHRYLNSQVGINFRTPDKFETAALIGVEQDHFTICDQQVEVCYHFPYRMVLSVAEPRAGAKISTGFFSKKHRLLIQVYHMVIYKGAVGIGFSF